MAPHHIVSTLPTRPFTLADAQDAGVERSQLSRLTIDGELRRMLNGVYVPSYVADSVGLRCEALRLVVPADVFICDRTAAWLHGATGALAPGEHQGVPLVSMFRASDAGRVRNPITDSGERRIRPSDVMELHGLRVTTPLRTALDLGRLQRTVDLRLAGLDAMLRLGLFSHDELLAEVSRFDKQRGVVVLRVLALRADGGAASFAESALRNRWCDAGLPRPQTQIPIEVDGVVRFFLDMGIEDWLLAAEYDGEEWHGEEHAEHDDSRRTWLETERAWQIEVFRKEHTFGHHQDAEQRLHRCAAAARAMLDRRRTFT
ncbi:hypothetical protein NPS01_06320 [Nocardioides psychrotolerans]|uniref:Transcriptional regulator, AbiEi antitoxin, Type IV TA system n=1 Tax=Nocardioides psychrotolerans TaxID=1005945 RepID=A0A1I3CZW1_9ACTN|nr:type IV toxin-antitoxin system AbiEi family antitoxin domain-containing protein [Nocardioides psychrotolerans]GEP36969.1 hypothetical protein NPS01_06320 [Nocardioides psychrotolerans]SFH79809.1 Transcriptional regulator, AbiEi antitoxin, Type IV TA system [Nocardioides psychrotolerans]